MISGHVCWLSRMHEANAAIYHVTLNPQSQDIDELITTDMPMHISVIVCHFIGAVNMYM